MGGILAGTDHIHNKCQYVSPHQMTNTSMKQCMSCTDHSAIKLHLERQMLNCLKMAFCVRHTVCPRIGDCVLKVKVFSGRPYIGSKWGALWSLIPQLTWAFWSGSPTTVNMGVCVLQSVGLGLFAWVLLLPRLLESVFAFLYLFLLP